MVLLIPTPSFSFVDKIRGKTYAEVCYGDGDLEDQLMDVATCKWRSDIRETVGCSKVLDALDITKEDLKGIDMHNHKPSLPVVNASTYAGSFTSFETNMVPSASRHDAQRPNGSLHGLLRLGPEHRTFVLDGE
jgi:hypothetical protein